MRPCATAESIRGAQPILVREHLPGRASARGTVPSWLRIEQAFTRAHGVTGAAVGQFPDATEGGAVRLGDAVRPVAKLRGFLSHAEHQRRRPLGLVRRTRDEARGTRIWADERGAIGRCQDRAETIATMTTRDVRLGRTDWRERGLRGRTQPGPERSCCGDSRARAGFDDRRRRRRRPRCRGGRAADQPGRAHQRRAGARSARRLRRQTSTASGRLAASLCCRGRRRRPGRRDRS